MTSICEGAAPWQTKDTLVVQAAMYLANVRQLPTGVQSRRTDLVQTASDVMAKQLGDGGAEMAAMYWGVAPTTLPQHR